MPDPTRKLYSSTFCIALTKADEKTIESARKRSHADTRADALRCIIRAYAESLEESEE